MVLLWLHRMEMHFLRHSSPLYNKRGQGLIRQCLLASNQKSEPMPARLGLLAVAHLSTALAQCYLKSVFLLELVYPTC